LNNISLFIIVALNEVKGKQYHYLIPSPLLKVTRTIERKGEGKACPELVSGMRVIQM